MTINSVSLPMQQTTTPSLIQELNLARRACWHCTNAFSSLIKTKKCTVMINKKTIFEINEATSPIKTSDIIPNRNMIEEAVRSATNPTATTTTATTIIKTITIDDKTKNINGANYLGKKKRSYLKLNCDSSSFVNSVKSSQLCRMMMLIAFYVSYSNIKRILTTTLKLFRSRSVWCNGEWLNVDNAKKINNSSNKKQIISKSVKPKLGKSSCYCYKGCGINKCLSNNNYFISVFLIGSVILLCSGNTVEARPNQSSDSVLVVDTVAAGSKHSHQITPPGLAATYPGLSLTSVGHPGTQSKRAAETSTESTEPEVIHNKHDIKSYPVAQVEFDRVKTPFIIGIWILSASIAKIGFHMTPKLHKMFPESCLLIVVGVIIGVVLYFATDVEVSPLTPNTFFFYMLPPIILDAGYFMPNRLFFDNLGTILLMAVIGTIFNISTIGASLWGCGLTGLYGKDLPLLDTFLFTSVISAVDPVAVLAVFEEIHVNEILYIVVFGESLLNDAVTVVVYHMMEAYKEIGDNITAVDIASGVASFFVVALGGTIIGVIWGFLTGLVTRFTDHVRVIEPIFIFVMAYLAYLNAEIFHMSGILAITFCGITMKNYVESNISQKSHTTVKYALKMLSSSAETIIFMFLGVATVNNRHEWNTWFVLITILSCTVFRVLGVILLTAMANRFRLHKLSNVDQFVMSYGGLRGAVAFALVLLIDAEGENSLQPMFVTTTIAVIYFTVFLQGITIKPLVKFLNVKRASKKKPSMNERIHERFMDHLMAGIEDIVGKTGNYNVRDKFKRFDNRFIRPYLIRDLKGAEPKIIETYSKLTMRDAMEVMRRNPSTIGQMSGTESMSALFRNYTTNYLGGRCAASFFNTCPSLTNLETCSRNLDMHELDYNPSKKDLTDAKIHHLLAEELKPYRRASIATHRRLSYSRHAVDDRDLSTQVNYKMHMNIRRMVNDRKHHKRSKRGANKDNLKQNHVSFHDFQQNGSTKQFSHDYINDVLNESAEDNPKSSSSGGGQNDDWDDGLTFTAKSSPDSDRANNNSLIAHITSLPGFDASKARIVSYASRGGSPDKIISPDIGPTAAELILPWRRDRSYHSFVGETAVIPEEDRHVSRDSDSERRVATPTAIESQLPWKRNEDDGEDGGAVQQNEFPAWASNKEYLAYNSPSATFLGGLSKPKQAKSVIGLFRRESSGSGSVIAAGGGGSDGVGSDPALAGAPPGTTPAVSTPVGRTFDKRSASIDAGATHSGPFPVTASHRRNTRRGSMLELSGDEDPSAAVDTPESPSNTVSGDIYLKVPEINFFKRKRKKDIIPEENNYTKSLPGDKWNTGSSRGGPNSGQTATTPGGSNIGSTGTGRLNRVGSGREPLLPKHTPNAQIRRMNQNQVTTALLSSSNSTDTDTEDGDDDDDEDEDVNVYDEDLIVNVNTSNRRSGDYGSERT